VASLRRMSAAHANVVRNGVRQSIVATEVVLGDVLLIEEGDIITADGRLFESTSLQMAEATLTGESLPVAGNARRRAARWLDQGLRRHSLRADDDLYHVDDVQLFNVFNTRSDDRSAFIGLFDNRWL
jgi:magnesium-transporting ATPase (P-type)